MSNDRAKLQKNMSRHLSKLEVIIMFMNVGISIYVEHNFENFSGYVSSFLFFHYQKL